MSSETILQSQVCQFIKAQYPDVIFTSESSGVRLTIGQAKKAKGLRSGNNLPDLIILEPRGLYHGLCIELKKDSPYRKDGSLKQDEHIYAQNAMLGRLILKGYMACFGVGLEATLNIIKMYMNHECPNYPSNERPA